MAGIFISIFYLHQIFYTGTKKGVVLLQPPCSFLYASPKSLFENYPCCGRLWRPMAASAAKMGLHRSPTTLPAPFSCFLALESLAQPRDAIIFKQALRFETLLKAFNRLRDDFFRDLGHRLSHGLFYNLSY